VLLATHLLLAVVEVLEIMGLLLHSNSPNCMQANASKSSIKRNKTKASDAIYTRKHMIRIPYTTPRIFIARTCLVKFSATGRRSSWSCREDCRMGTAFLLVEVAYRTCRKTGQEVRLQ